jgi:adenosylcobinamide-GDP ribazoletransferase
MADGRIGTYGVLALVLDVAARATSLSLLADLSRIRVLLLAPVLGRFACVVAAAGARAAKPEGLGAAFVASLEARDVGVAAGTALVLAVVLCGLPGLVAAGVAAAVARAVRAVGERRFGGVTGDVLGAAGELAEVVALGLLASEL